MDWGNALNDVNRCIEIDPTFVKAYIRKGKIEHFMKKYHKAVETYKKGLEIDPQNRDLAEAMASVQMAINAGMYSGEVDQERQQRAMEDPEVQKILKDPHMNQILQQMQENPSMAQKAMQDPAIRTKIQTLVNAGVLQMR